MIEWFPGVPPGRRALPALLLTRIPVSAAGSFTRSLVHQSFSRKHLIALQVTSYKLQATKLHSPSLYSSLLYLLSPHVNGIKSTGAISS
ncbi:hypothetical protein K445DRAFT_320237 [Daldinia sp. EC12]|nr:hypothetical protein K445DRAFT_320237 [Daldinia sp. EC12]